MQKVKVSYMIDENIKYEVKKKAADKRLNISEYVNEVLKEAVSTPTKRNRGY